MKTWLLKTGQWFRVVDENGQLSMTNLAVYISLYKLLTVPNASYAEVGTFLLASVAYNYKKYLGQNGDSNGS